MMGFNIRFHEIVDIVFGAGLFINAALFVPQIIRLFQKKESRDLSLITFVGFCAIQLVTIIHGYLNRDYILALGYGLSLITCGTVTMLILIYRYRQAKWLK